MESRFFLLGVGSAFENPFRIFWRFHPWANGCIALAHAHDLHDPVCPVVMHVDVGILILCHVCWWLVQRKLIVY